MTQHIGWSSYSGDARIELAVGLVAVAGAVVYAGTRLRQPVRAVRPGQGIVGVMFLAWAAEIAALLVCATFYIQQYLRDNDLTKLTGASDPVTPVTFSAVVAIFVIILTRGGFSFRARLGSAIIGALAAPWIFEVPFDLIVMARTASLQPNPAGYRALFFVPLLGVGLTTLALLILSPMVRLTRATFFPFALMLLVFAVWALDGFGYPSVPDPIALNMVSKVLAFATALTLFLPPRLSQWRTAQAPGPAAEQATLTLAGRSAGLSALVRGLTLRPLGYQIPQGAMRHGEMPRLITPMMASLRRGLPHGEESERGRIISAPSLRAVLGPPLAVPGPPVSASFLTSS